jgi:hypothetical protein
MPVYWNGDDKPIEMYGKAIAAGKSPVIQHTGTAEKMLEFINSAASRDKFSSLITFNMPIVVLLNRDRTYGNEYHRHSRRKEVSFR